VVFRLLQLTGGSIFTKNINMIYQNLQKVFCFFALVGLACCLGCKREATATPASNAALPGPEIMAVTLDSNACTSGPASDHHITQATALQMINKYQNAITIPGKLCQLYSQGGYVQSETFSAAAIRELLSQNDVCAVRIYNGVGTDNRQHLILAGVNSNGFDILGAYQQGARAINIGNTAQRLYEAGIPCPKICNGSYWH
jgi:hypothetical protein